MRISAIAVSALLLCCINVFADSDLILRFDPSAQDALPAAIHKVADDAYQLNVRGLDALERGDYNGALELFGKALEAFPQYTDALNNRGVALYRRGDAAGAQRVWEDVVKRDPQYHVGYFNIGLIYLQGKKPDDAMRQFQAALRHNPNFTEALLRIGVVHMQAKRTKAAVEQFAKAYKGAPAHRDAWDFYSYGLLVTGDTAGAMVVLQSVGDNPRALAQLGRIEAGRKRFAQAAQFLSRAVERGAPAAALLDLASVQIDAGSCKDAQLTLSNYFAKEKTPSVDAFLLAGAAAQECDGPAKALEQYDRGLKRYPRDPLLLHNMGQVYFVQKNYAKAEEVWGGLSESAQTPQTFYRRAAAARFRGDLAAAERHIRKAISMDENSEYCDFLGVILNAKGDNKAAEEQFRRALRLDPNNASAQLNMAVKSRNTADLEKAAADASGRLSSCKGKECVEAALQLSILYYHQKKINQALSTLESVREADRDLRVFRHIAIYNRELQQNDKAVAALEAAVKRFPGDMRVQYELAESYLTAGNPSKAAQIFISLQPKWKENVWRLHYQLGYAYKEMNDMANAKAAFERSMAAKKDNPAARALLAFVLNRMGETDKAVGHWEQTLKEDGSNAAIHINLGLSYFGRGQFDKALESYRKALSLAPSDRAIHINIGNAYQGMNRIPEAFDAFTRGLESDKRDLAAYNIFLLARKRNDNDRARRMADLLKKEFPLSAYNQRVSAEMELVKGDTAKALAAYEAIKEKDTDDWYALARIYAARGRKAETDAALARMPGDGQWGRLKNVVRAELAFTTRDFAGAYRAYRAAAAESGPDQEVNVYNMILAAYNAGMHFEAIDASKEHIGKVQGRARAEVVGIAANSAVASRNWGEAKNWFGQLSSLEPGNSVALYNLAVAHYNLGDIESAYNQYKKAQGLDRKIKNKDIEERYEEFKRGGSSSAAQSAPPPAPVRSGRDSLDIWYNEAVDLQNAKKEAQAEAIYKKILAVDPAFSLAWNNLGAIYGARGDLEEAEAAYLKALENQTAPETFANLANIYIALEDFAKAGDILAKGLAVNPNSALLKRMEQRVKSRK
ncbi:MAG: tetratricopeptide repeat protein [Chitinispirillia bacterium]|nr:tetratricopeptide repeat protein [Chitinispirillia bacterium]MCL2268013.1 tetratricopeptide repeat protein [Chitinispirillia bacterium]